MATATFFSFPQLFAPLQAFVHWLAGGSPEPMASPVPVRSVLPTVSCRAPGRSGWSKPSGPLLRCGAGASGGG